MGMIGEWISMFYVFMIFDDTFLLFLLSFLMFIPQKYIKSWLVFHFTNKVFLIR